MDGEIKLVCKRNRLHTCFEPAYTTSSVCHWQKIVAIYFCNDELPFLVGAVSQCKPFSMGLFS